MFKSVCKMFMTEINSKRDGSHSYRNVHDYNPIKKKWQSFEQKCARRQSIQKEMVVIRTEICMATINSKRNGRHEHLCTNDYHFFLNWLSSCTFLYEWLPFLFEWIVVMHISVRMTTISFWIDFRHARSVEMTLHTLYMYVSSYTFCEMSFHIPLVFHDVCNALQRVNSIEQWRIQLPDH